MKIVIAAVGRVREPELRSLLDDYYGRVRRCCELTEVEIRDARPEPLLDKLIASLTRPEVVALDIYGLSLSSEAFASRVCDAMNRASTMVFVIGGPEGLSQRMRDGARWGLSLGPLTLAHRLARLVLAEQIYRAFTIIRAEPYAREGRRT